MEVELKAEGHARALNNAVAITVVALSVVMAVSKIKDDNIVQAMQSAKADALDTWNEYQAERLKLHFAEQSLMMAKLQTAAPAADVQAAIAGLPATIAHYEQASKDLAEKAKGFQAGYDALNFRDDQFDLSDAGLAISLSLAAVAALTGLWWLLGISWLFGAGGLVMALAGFAGWSVHPDWLVGILT